MSVLQAVMRGCENIVLTDGLTVANHSLWCAHQAVDAKCDNPMIVAAMFHDIGHYILAGDSEISDYDKDVEHAVVGSNWLARWYPESVCAPIAMHVDAKRYLATVDRGYQSLLEGGSLQSFKNQGGYMNDNELNLFRNNKYFARAVKLRLFDDEPYEGQVLRPYAWYEETLMSVLEQV